MMFEGRHGNSLRIGSRDVDPYIILSNGRHPKNLSESVTDGSLISITEKGTLKQHFGAYKKIKVYMRSKESYFATSKRDSPKIFSALSALP